MKKQFDKLNRLSESHGALEPGKGLVSGVIAIILAAHIGVDWFILDLLGSTLIFVFIEKLFALRKDREWPNRYGVVGDYVPNGFFKQLAFPFVWKG